MSLVTMDRDTVTVQRRKAVDTAHGVTYQAEGDPTSVPCLVIELTATETDDQGLRTQTMRRVYARDWPGDVHSLVTTADGRLWEQRGKTQTYELSPLSTHAEVLLQEVTRG